MARTALKDQKGIKQRVSKSGAITYEKRLTINGKRYSVYGKTAKELEEKEKALRADVEAGITADMKKITLNQYFDMWVFSRKEEIKKGNLKESTLVVNCQTYNHNIRERIGNMKLLLITKQIIEKCLSEIPTVSVYNSSLRLLKKVFSDAMKEEIILKNPAALITEHKAAKKDEATDIHRALTLKEQETFCKAAQDSFYYEYILFMLGTGCRSGEADALLWSDIDFKEKTIHIQRTATKSLEGTITVGSPKTAKGDRVIPMTAAVEGILKSQRQKNVDFFGNVIQNRVFNTMNGGMIYSKCMEREIDYILRRLRIEQGIRIEHFSTHAFRDTYATRCIEAGMNPKTLQSYLGHTTLAMTMDRYVKVTPDTMRREMVDVFAM